MIKSLNKNSDSKCSQESSRIPVLKTVSFHAGHVMYRRTLLRTLQAEIRNTIPLSKSLSCLLKKDLDSFMPVFTVSIKTICHSYKIDVALKMNTGPN